MSYTPVELRHVKVRRSLFGYDRAKVEELLDEVVESFEAVWRDRGELTDRVEELQKQLAAIQEREQLLSQTLVAAEAAAAELREQARREAEVIVAEAHGDARSVSRNAQAERDRLITEAKRIEGFLRGALGLVEQASAQSVGMAETAEKAPPTGTIEPAADERDDAPDEEGAAAELDRTSTIWPREERTDEDPLPQPFLRRVVGGEGHGFDWGD